MAASLRLTRRLALALWLLCLCFLPKYAYSSLSAATVWECRASGASDNNGGGFKAGATGTDYTQQNAAQLTLTDLATTGVVTTLTSVTGGFTAQMVGDDIHIVSGTNFTAGFYEITAFTNSNTVTVDRAPSTAAGAAGTGSVGGALATLSTLSGAMVSTNKAYCTGAFTSTATTTFAQAAAQTFVAPSTRLIGYGASRTDGLHATLTLATNTGLTALAFTTGAFEIENFDVDCGSLGTSKGMTLGSFSVVRNCKVANFTTSGISGTTNNFIRDSELTGGSGTAAIDVTSTCHLLRNFIHDNTCIGIRMTVMSAVIDNLIVNNSGGSSHGISLTSIGDDNILNNTIHNNGGDGIRIAGANFYGLWVKNNLITNNGGIGLDNTATGIGAYSDFDGNAFFSNTGGNRNGLDSVTGIFGVNSYVNTRDITATTTPALTVSPYVGPTTGTTANFALNNTASGGASLRGKGSPGTWPGNTGSTGALDFGAVQSAAGANNPPQIISSAFPDAFVLLLAITTVGSWLERRRARRT